MKISRVGVDLAKSVFQVHGVDTSDHPVWRRQLRRNNWIQVLEQNALPGCVIGMEACAGAHHWGRELRARGFDVRLIAPQFVKPYVKSNKTDRNDAEAICEAVSRPSMRFVPLKTIDQQDIQAIHRVRSELIKSRNAKANQIRGLVAEYGIVAPRQIAQLRKAIHRWLEDAENGLTCRFRRLLAGMREDLAALDQRIKVLDLEVAEVAKADPTSQRLMQLQGVGPLIATAFASSLGDGRSFRKGREYAVSLGLTPRQHSSGGKDRMLGISKRGDAYMRMLLIQGARSVMLRAEGKDDPLNRWVQGLMARKHSNVVAVALASKTARAAWAIVRNEAEYKPELMAAVA
ncbi:MAG: IS110 family transposase [Granulosicoccaceae bacterium]